MRVVTLSIAVLALLAQSQQVLAWGDFGHMQVAEIAYTRLAPIARKRTGELLKLNPRYSNWTNGFSARSREHIAFVVASTWADAIKNDPEYDDKEPGPGATPELGYADKHRHGAWHYVNHPFSPDGTPLIEPSGPNVETQVHAFLAALADPSVSEEVKSYALTWLLHIVGDIHQPLHCVSRFDSANPEGDRGGNSVELQGQRHPTICDDPRFCWKEPSPKLHVFWDAIVGSSCCVVQSIAAAARLPPASLPLVLIVNEVAWAREGLELAQRVVYAPPIGIGSGPFAIDDAYAGAALELAKRRIALAGARLAKVLNAAFAAEWVARRRG